MELKGSKTEKNLIAAFAGESQARNKYAYFASVAKREGYEQISAIFQETADNEKEHAKRFFKFLKGGHAVEITESYGAGVIGTTKENLEAAASGENMEWTVIYKEAADVAAQEGFADIAKVFRSIAKIEKEHEERYLTLLKNIENSTVFKKTDNVQWKCRNCGYVHDGSSAPEVCPACAHPQKYFELRVKNY